MVAMMEPRENENLEKTLQVVRDRIGQVFGPPTHTEIDEQGRPVMFWKQETANQGTAMVHLRIFTDRPEPAVRADFQGPRWQQVADEFAVRPVN